MPDKRPVPGSRESVGYSDQIESTLFDADQDLASGILGDGRDPVAREAGWITGPVLEAVEPA